MKKIEITEELYDALAQLAGGFDTPADVIRRLLDSYRREKAGSNATGKKDTTKYMFQGQLVGKGRFVQEIVTEYVKEHPAITYDELKAVFPDRAQGSLGVFTEINKGNTKRFFKESIKLSDSIILVCNQWGIGNIGNFLTIAEKLNYDVEQIPR